MYKYETHVFRTDVQMNYISISSESSKVEDLNVFDWRTVEDAVFNKHYVFSRPYYNVFVYLKLIFFEFTAFPANYFEDYIFLSIYLHGQNREFLAKISPAIYLHIALSF
jgi:hypothetical protein